MTVIPKPASVLPLPSPASAFAPPPAPASFPEPGKAPVPASDAVGMKLTCKQADLASGLADVFRAVMPRSTRPILQHILLSTDQGRVCLQATDLEIGIQVWRDAQIEAEGTTALPAELLTKMISLMPSGPLTLTTAAGSQTLDIQAAGSATSIRGQDPREFPLIPCIEAGVQHCSVMEAGLLKKMIEAVAFAAATDESRPVLMAVFFHISHGTLTMAAVNTYRCVEFVAPLATAVDAPPILIPAQSLRELARILPAQGKVQMLVTPKQNQVMFQCEEGNRLNFVSRLIEGEYPPYQRALPQVFPTTALVETRLLSTAISRASLFAKDELKTIRVTLKGGSSGSLTVEAEDTDMGRHVSSIAAQVTGPECQLFFPVRYLREAIEHLDVPLVAFSVLSAGKPGVLKPTNDMRYTSMIMSAREKDAVSEKRPPEDKPQE